MWYLFAKEARQSTRIFTPLDRMEINQQSLNLDSYLLHYSYIAAFLAL